MREIFVHWIYTFQTILSNFGFCGRKAPLPLAVTSSVSCWPSGVNYFIPVISVRASQEQHILLLRSQNRQVLWLFYIFSSNLCEIGLQCVKMYTFHQLETLSKNLAEKPPPQDEGKFFDTGSIHFRQF